MPREIKVTGYNLYSPEGQSCRAGLIYHLGYKSKKLCHYKLVLVHDFRLDFSTTCDNKLPLSSSDRQVYILRNDICTWQDISYRDASRPQECGIHAELDMSGAVEFICRARLRMGQLAQPDQILDASLWVIYHKVWFTPLDFHAATRMISYLCIPHLCGIYLYIFSYKSPFVRSI